MAGISWLCPRGSEGGPDAEVPHARPRVGADVDQAIARIPALAVHVWVEARVAGDREQVLARDVHAGRRGATEQQASSQSYRLRRSFPHPSPLLASGLVRATSLKGGSNEESNVVPGSSG